MREVVIKAGTYGYRNAAGRVQPVARGDSVTVSDAEAARLVGLKVAAYTDDPAQAPDGPPVAPPGGAEPPGASTDTPSGSPGQEAVTGGEEDNPADVEVARLERMSKGDLEKMAQDMGVDISGARNNHERAVLIAAASTSDDGDAPPNLEAGDIVQ